MDLHNSVATLVAAVNVGMFAILFTRMVVLIQYFRMGYYTKVQEMLALLQIVVISAVLVAQIYTVSRLV